jgi:protein-S-isoprenylcysteine O-methyltransferase Ste14
MYVGVSLALFGEIILLGSTALLVYTLTVITAFHLFVIFFEEPTLESQFGDAYRQYCRAVPRWIPRLHRT